MGMRGTVDEEAENEGQEGGMGDKDWECERECERECCAWRDVVCWLMLSMRARLLSDRRLLRAAAVGVVVPLGSRLEAQTACGFSSSSGLLGGALGGGGIVMVDERVREGMSGSASLSFPSRTDNGSVCRRMCLYSMM